MRISFILFLYYYLTTELISFYAAKPLSITYDETHYQCKASKPPGFTSNIRGVNIGGWLVLEPWITPSLFYQFLNTDKKYAPKEVPSKTAMDMYTFCQVLGPIEGNRQLRQHWKTFVQEKDIRQLKKRGVNSIRVPVGDWMYKPYPPYTGCTNGSTSEFNRILDLAEKYNMTVLIDIHGHRHSQNGFDNSGQARDIQWHITPNSAKFSHWSQHSAHWAGHFDASTNAYTSINYKNIYRSLHVVRIITSLYKNRKSIIGISTMNEPSEYIPMKILKKFYWSGYKIVKKIAPHWGVVIDFFSRVHEIAQWKGFMKGCPDVAIDAHLYQAWTHQIYNNQKFFWENACEQKQKIQQWETHLPVIIGEWSLATDTCVMWLSGFNDNLEGFPHVECKYVNCPPGKLDRSLPLQGPFSTTGTSGPVYGKCPVTNGHVFSGLSQHQMYGLLGRLKLDAFSAAHGFYFWTFKTELDSKWSFLRATEKGYLPYNITNFKSKYNGLCHRYRERKEYKSY